MKKIVYLFTATLAFTIQGVAMAAELTENIDSIELNNLQQELCNNPTVTQILTDNMLDEQYIPPATGGGDDDYGYVVINTVQPISAEEALTSLCS